MAKLNYIGPDYKKGLNVHGIPRLLKPREWSQKKIGSMIKRHPQLDRFFSSDAPDDEDGQSGTDSKSTDSGESGSGDSSKSSGSDKKGPAR